MLCWTTLLNIRTKCLAAILRWLSKKKKKKLIGRPQFSCSDLVKSYADIHGEWEAFWLCKKFSTTRTEYNDREQSVMLQESSERD